MRGIEYNDTMNKRLEKKRNPILGIFLLVLVIIMSSAAGLGVWWITATKPVDPDDRSEVALTIPSGYGSAGIGHLLEDEDLIRSYWAFRILIYMNELNGKLQAGSYILSKAQSPLEIARSLTIGKEEEFSVTIPEGKRREEIARILRDAFDANGSPFSIDEFMDLTDGMEGYLFPETYLLPKSTTTADVVTIMRGMFDQKVTSEMSAESSQIGLDMEDVIILASLVEREAKFEQDRPMVAGVMLNRLDIGMPLQIDASIQYAVGQDQCRDRIGSECDWWPVLRSTDYDSPYNTYQNPGLPPSPIANPGLSVIEAVLNPTEHDYLFYISENNGTTHYSETLDQHNILIERYLR